MKLPDELSPSLHTLAELELALGNSIVRVEQGVWSDCPLAIVFAQPLHFVEAAAGHLVGDEIERWESHDPHYSVEAGYLDKASRQTLAGPIG